MTLICSLCSSSPESCSCASRQGGPIPEIDAPIETCTVGDGKYLIHSHILGAIQGDIKPSALIPVTLLNTDEIFNGRLDQILNEFDAIDDVFRPEFGSVLVEKPTTSSVAENNIANRQLVLKQRGCSRTLYKLQQPWACSLTDLKELPSGPYFLRGPNIHAACALRVDHYHAFARGLVPDNIFQPRRYQELNVLSDGGLFPSIAVPSTLYFRNDESGLRGVRMSFSETMRLEGLPESFSNRDYAMSNRLSAETNAMAQKLIDLGAVIVGQTKVPELLAGAWEGSAKPWNPRGDQIQDPGTGSTGAAVAVAGYNWLQMAFAVDSYGGLRIPAARNGVYALRVPSNRQSVVDQLLNDHLDGYAVAARSFADLQLACTALHQQVVPRIPMRMCETQMVTKVISLDWGTGGADKFPPEQRNCLEHLYRTVSQKLGVQIESMNLEKEWRRCPPTGLSLLEQIDAAPYKLLSKTWRHYFDDFWADFERWHGREPFSDTRVRRSRCLGDVDEEQAACLHEDLVIVRDWFRNLVASQTKAKDERTLILFPDIVVEPTERRREYQPDPEALTYSQFITHWLSSIARCSQVVIPFAQIETSPERNTQVEGQALPVTVSLLSVGDASALLESVQSIVECLPSEVQTGEWAFPQDSTYRAG